MARRPKSWTELDVEKLIAEGRGKGEGKDYLPWIRVNDFSSLGTSRKVFGLKTHREHHLLSNVEFDLFLLLEWTDDVVDIREQFPLDREITIELAKTLGIQHPTYPGTKIPAVMTADFLVTRAEGSSKRLEAFNAKTASELETKPRSLEKLEIQRVYFSSMGFSHHIVLDSELPQAACRNIEWIRQSHERPGEKHPFDGFLDVHRAGMLQHLQSSSPRSTLSEVAKAYESIHGLSQGTGLRLIRLLLLSKQVITDIKTDRSLETQLLGAFTLPRAKRLAVVGGRQ